MVYILSFVCSVSLLACVEHRRPWTVERGLVGFVALLIPCLVAAFRADSIGTDVMIYARPLFDLASNASSFGAFLDSTWVGGWVVREVADIEVGFSFLTYLVAKATHSFAALLFCVQALTIVPIYCALRKMGDGVSTWLGMATYLFLYFNSSLNAMRQWMAIGFLLLAFAYLFQNKKRCFALLMIVAALFHTSSVLMLFVAVMYWYIEGRKPFNDSTGVLRFLIVVVLSIGVLPGLQLISSILDFLGFGQYVVGYLTGTVNILPNQILLRLPALLLALSCLMVRAREGVIPSGRFFAALVILDIVTSQLGSVSDQSTRIALYFGMFQIVFFPLAAQSQPTRFRKGVVTTAILAYLAAYWYVYYVFFGWSATFPYVAAGM